jgi:Autophagy-related protein 101
VDDPELQALIESKTNAFIRYVDSLPQSSSTAPTPQSTSDSPADAAQISKEGTIKSQIEIHFYEKVTRRASWWTAKISESEVCWEKWELNCEFLPVTRNERGIAFSFWHI